jgi:hypothetical protein
MRNRKRLTYLLGLGTGLLVAVGLSGSPAQAATPVAHIQSVVTGGSGNWDDDDCDCDCNEDSWDNGWGDDDSCDDNDWGTRFRVSSFGGGDWGGRGWGHHRRWHHHHNCDNDD